MNPFTTSTNRPPPDESPFRDETRCSGQKGQLGSTIPTFGNTKGHLLDQILLRENSIKGQTSGHIPKPGSSRNGHLPDQTFTSGSLKVMVV